MSDNELTIIFVSMFHVPHSFTAYYEGVVGGTYVN